MEMIKFLSPGTVVEEGIKWYGNAGVKHNARHVIAILGSWLSLSPRPFPATNSFRSAPAFGCLFTSAPLSRTRSFRASVTSGRAYARLPDTPGCSYHGCYQWWTAMEVELRVAREALRVWGFKEACQRTKDEIAGRQGVPKGPRNCASAIPVNLPPSFSRGVAPLGRVEPRFLPSTSLCAGFLFRAFPAA